MKKAFLDLDGTLIDSSSRHLLVLKDVCRNHEVCLQKEDSYLIYKSIGNNTFRYLTDIEHVDSDLAREISADWIRQIEDEKYLAADVWYEDAYDFVAKLAELGYEISVLSARQNASYPKAFIQNSPLAQFIHTMRFVNPADAKVEKMQYIRQEKSQHSIIVGDTEAEWKAAEEVGIACFVLNRGFRSKEYWDLAGVKSYSNLNEVIAELIRIDWEV